MANYIAFDFETTMNGYGRSPHPSFPTNKILAYSIAGENDGKPYVIVGNNRIMTSAEMAAKVANDLVSERNYAPDFIIGHNMKFDVEYIYFQSLHGHLHLRMLVESKAQWWDTQIAHYILSGQRDTYPSLKTAISRYPGSLLKSDYLEKFLTDNPTATTECCNIEELTEYCGQDSKATLLLAKKQMHEALSVGKFALIIAMCDALRAVTEMECKGLVVDLKAYESATIKYQALAQDNLNMCLELMDRATTYNTLFNFVGEATKESFSPKDWAEAIFCSAQSLSHLLFGSTKDKEYKIVIGKTKAGRNKWGKFSQKAHFGMLPKKVQADVTEGETRNANGSWSVDTSMLGRIESHSGTPPVLADFVRKLLLHREYDKIVSTYLNPLYSMIRVNDTVHHTLHQTSTATGRLSASNPNFQNFPNVSDVKGIFIPQRAQGMLAGLYEEQVFLEFDYKQLEVIGIAYVTGDEALKRDVRANVDIHTKVGSRVYGRPPTKDERRGIKTVVFAMLYGSGIANIVKTSGLAEPLVTNIVREFKTAYPGVFKHHRLIMDELTKKATLTKLTDKDCVNLESRTGRSYALPIYRDVTATGVQYRPSWTQVCNYPCQGFATGDIVPMMLGVLLDSRKNFEYPFNLRNTVHDSILVSCAKEDWMEVHKHIKGVLQNPYPHLKRLFGITDFDLPLLVEASMGSDWGNMLPITAD